MRELSGRLEDWLRELEATYTEHGSITSEKPENRSKSWARNRLDLQLRELLKTAIVWEETASGLLCWLPALPAPQPPVARISARLG